MEMCNLLFIQRILEIPAMLTTLFRFIVTSYFDVKKMIYRAIFAIQIY